MNSRGNSWISGPAIAENARSPINKVGRSTIHTNPGWKDTLRREFQELIVDNCSRNTIDAVKNNDDIQVSTRNDAISETYLSLVGSEVAKGRAK